MYKMYKFVVSLCKVDKYLSSTAAEWRDKFQSNLMIFKTCPGILRFMISVSSFTNIDLL